MRRLALAVVAVLASCATTPPALPASHPASARAPIGRLAGPPATLRPGVVTYDLPPPRAAEPEQHHHHHHAP
jgi:hypothetical protein